MTCRTSRPWRAGPILAAAMAIAVLGCGGGGEGGDSTGGATPTSETSGGHSAAKNGRIVIVGEDGRLASVNPDGTDRRDIEGPGVEPRGGIRLTASGIAFFRSAGDDPQLVMVDGEDGKMTALAPIEPHYLGPALGLALDVGGGTRFAFFPDTSGDGGGVFVDIERRSAIPITDKRDPGARLFTFEISPDERHLIAIGQDTLVFRTDDPDDVQRLPRELAGATFAPDGQTMFSTRHREGESAVVRVPVGGGDPEVLAEGDDLRSLGTVGNSVVIQDGTDIFLTEKPGDRRVIKSDVSEDLDLLVASRTPGEHAVLEARSEGEDGDKTSTWAMIDGTGSSLVEHPELNGFHPVPTDGRSVVLSSVDLTESRDPATGPVTLAVLNASTGVVTTATIPDPAGPSVQQSPDGTVTAVSLRRPESKSPVTLIIGAGTEAETAGQFAGWAPDGSALLVISLVDGQPHAMVASLDGKVQTDLGPAFNAVWVPE